MAVAGMVVALLGVPALRAEPGPEETPRAMYAVLLQAMKGGASLGLAGRLKLLDPELRRDLNLPLMTRLVVGPPWRSLSQKDQQRLVDAFSNYSIAVYASRFNDYSGERFIVDPSVTALPGGDRIAHTKLVPTEGDPVQLDYRMRRGDGGWRIIDVFLSGTISELATRRSEYSTVLRSGGAEALVRLLKQKTAELGG